MFAQLNINTKWEILSNLTWNEVIEKVKLDEFKNCDTNEFWKFYMTTKLELRIHPDIEVKDLNYKLFDKILIISQTSAYIHLGHLNYYLTKNVIDMGTIFSWYNPLLSDVGQIGCEYRKLNDDETKDIFNGIDRIIISLHENNKLKDKYLLNEGKELLKYIFKPSKVLTKKGLVTLNIHVPNVIYIDKYINTEDIIETEIKRIVYLENYVL